jgi:Ribbon-helix-helix protein, copG family
VRAEPEDHQALGRKKKSITQKQLEVLSARVPFDLYRQVELLAQKRELTLTQIVRQSIKEYVERQHRSAAA